MEDVYTIKVKTKPDTRNLYPSERRYSASTVSGLAWVHIALSATSFLLALLALVNPSGHEKTDLNNLTDTSQNTNETLAFAKNDGIYILVLAPTMLSVFALAAGVASIMASVKWYIDRNITWLFIMSVLSTLCAFTCFVMVVVWLASTAEDMTEFYKDQEPFKDILVIKHSDVIDKNDSHIIIALNTTQTHEESSRIFSKRVLSINILIATFLELLWSILSVKIAYKGMRRNYKEDDTQRRGNCISVVTTIKGNNPKNFTRNGKLIPPKPDLINHYPSKKIKRIFLDQSDNGFYMKNQNGKTKQNTETSSEFYKERMMNFLNRCASLEGISNPEITPSVQSDAALNPIPEVASVEINLQKENENEGDETPISWGDSPDHTIYNQNNLNLDRIFTSFTTKKRNGDEKKIESEINENTTGE